MSPRVTAHKEAEAHTGRSFPARTDTQGGRVDPRGLWNRRCGDCHLGGLVFNGGVGVMRCAEDL